MDSLAIEFETANASRGCACAIGWARISDGRVVHSESLLIRPKQLDFDPYNVHIHGITEEDVQNEQEFDALWPQLRQMFVGCTLVAHNAGFDLGVLRHVLDAYGIPCPELRYFCTRLLAKRVWPGLVSYSLPVVADHLGIQFDHHAPAEDAVACAKILLRACREKDASDPDELASSLDIREGELRPGGYRAPYCRTSSKLDLTKIDAASTDFDKTHPFFGRVLVFTGTLQSMARGQAAQDVVDCGGLCGNSVTKKTNYLVLGDQDFRKLKGRTNSAKMRKAEALIADGADLEVIPEEDFLSLLRGCG